MFENAQIFTTDKVWKNILCDIGANVADNLKSADVNLDELNLEKSIHINDLIVAINNKLEMDDNNIIKTIIKQNIKLPKLQIRILSLLLKNNGMGINDMKSALGYCPDTTTRSIENAISSLRKKTNKDLIINNDGKYYIGKL